MKTKLSVVVPCYNEEQRIKDGFQHLYSYLKNQKYNWEIIFVDDGSTDKTLTHIKTLSKGKTNIKVEGYEKNKGKGYAISYGVKKASGEIILFTDVDHSVDIKTIDEFFDYFKKGYKVVIGSRRIKGATIKVHQGIIRETLGRGFTLTVNLLISPEIADATCGFKAFENKAAQRIFKKISIFDWAFDAEIIYICKKFKIKIAQAPVVWSNVGGSKVSLKKDVATSLLGIFKIRAKSLLGYYSK